MRPIAATRSAMWIAIEGNIGSGKSTLIRKLAADGYRCIPEPVNDWQSIVNEETGENLLTAYYNNPTRYAFTLQTFTFQSRLNHMREISSCTDDIVFTERSIDTDYYVFGRCAIYSHLMDPLEQQVYQSWFQFHRNLFPATPDVIVYLRTPVDECLRRIEWRNRDGEANIKRDYLMALELLHDDWLLNRSDIVVLDGLKSLDELKEELVQVVNEQFEHAYDTRRLR